MARPKKNTLYNTDRKDIKSMSRRELDQLVKDNMKLVNKLVNQWYKKTLCDWDMLLGMAMEGFALAIKNYDPVRSNMSFGQYLAYSIRNRILICLPEEAQVISINSYACEKFRKEGTQLSSVGMSVICGDHEERGSKEYRYGMYYESVNGQDLNQTVYNSLLKQFKPHYADIFFRFYGLGDYEKTTGKDLAAEYGVSSMTITKYLKDMREYLKTQPDVIEALQELL